MNNAVHYEDALMVKAAWYYYFENLTQQAIADRLSISRMRVIKLLAAARQDGFTTLRESCRELVLSGVTSAAEAARVINTAAET